MKAVVFDQFGGPEVLSIRDVDTPKPAPNELLVKVHATALNRADTLQRQGKYPPPPGESDILGLEIAGEVVDCGDAVVGFHKGDRVFGLVGGGAYAEYCVLDAQMAMPIPDCLNYSKAAAIPEAFLTAQEALFSLGQLQSGERVLIHAGASGVGSAAIQLAKQSGVEVFITAGSDQKIAFCKALGADHGINYKTQSFAEEITALTQNTGVDVIMDFVGAAYWADNIKLLNTAGRLVLIATLSGPKVEINIVPIMAKRLQIKGITMRSRPLPEKREIAQRFASRFLPLFSTDKLKPVIDCVLPIQEVQEAHRMMESNSNQGKIVLIW